MTLSKDQIPAWVTKRYALLWKRFGVTKFTFSEAVKSLNDDGKFVSVLLSDLKKLGWVKIELDHNDSRRRVYQLSPINEVSSGILKSAFGGEIR